MSASAQSPLASLPSDPARIPDIPPGSGMDAPDELTRQELASLRSDQAKDRRFLRWARNLFTPALLCVTVGWLIFVAAAITASGFGLRPGWPWITQPFHLSDAILGGLLGATTIGILGLAKAVTEHIFPRTPAPPKT